MANKPTGLQKANQKKKNIKFAKNFPQKLAVGKKMERIKQAHKAMQNPEETHAANEAVKSKLAKAKAVHSAIGENAPSKPGFKKSSNVAKKMELPVIQKQAGKGAVAPIKRGETYGSAKSAVPVSQNPPHVQRDINKREEAKDYAKYQSAQPKTEAPAFGPRSTGQTSSGAGAFGSKPGVHADPYTAKLSASAKSFTGPTASQKVIAGMSEAGRQAKDKKQKKMAAFGKNVAGKVKAASVAAKERHDQKPGLNPMDYKGASMSKHLRHAFSDKGPIGKAVNKITGKYDRGFEKVAAPVERGIKSAAKGTVEGVKAAGRGVKAVGKALVSPTAQGIGQAALTHAGMAIMHGSNYPQKMHELSQQGPRTFRPGWHGFTAPEKTHDTDATDTRGERS